MFKLDVVVILRLINMKAVVLSLTMFDKNINVCMEKCENESLYGNRTFIYGDDQHHGPAACLDGNSKMFKHLFRSHRDLEQHMKIACE